MKAITRTLVAFVLLLGLCEHPGAQSLSYTKGQTISPAYEGWEETPDGSRYFLFGYMNRNWEEELDIPVGPENGFNVGEADRDQPTHFLPRRNRFVFRVKVPAGFSEKDELIWTLTSYGKTNKAYASLRLDYKVDDVVKASETGALGAGTSSPETRSNKPPTVSLETPKTVTITVGQPLTLTADVVDDGIPRRRGGTAGAARGAGRGGTAEAPAAGRATAPPANAGGQPARGGFSPPSRITVGKVTGLHLSWFVYRGSGEVVFDPQQVKVWEDTRAGANSPWAPGWTAPAMPADGRLTVRATFSGPGNYVLRALADDGALLGGADVTVTVIR